MASPTETLLKEALALEPTERAALVSELLSSLDPPDARVDELWVRESLDRLAAYDTGQMKAMPVYGDTLDFLHSEVYERGFPRSR